MSRRTPRLRRASADALTPLSPCPCGLPAAFGACCGRFHTGEAAAPSAELLMRSRYSAFVTHDTPYLLRTWHPSTRPPSLELDPGLRWSGLEIVDAVDGTAFHTTGTVTFRARYRHHGNRGELYEHSRFARDAGAWVYVDGTFIE
ncbi:YchJ family metal-binding protein [Streptomyces sp. CAU 1734]|uniref:YchJ family protein n=1 Tax=Streptomyces sp. CAU 1734 TaxID=3140360 RepID=UPI003261D218